MKKQLSILAGSMLVAAGSNAITLGNDVIAYFNTAGAGTYYQSVGVSAADLASGTGFSIDVSAAEAALGGTIETFAIVALLDGDGGGSPFVSAEGSYNYTEFLYVENNGGLITAETSTRADTSNNAAKTLVNNIAGFLNNATFGLNGEGSLGDADANAIALSFLTNGVNQLTLLSQQAAGGSTANTELVITSPNGVPGVNLVGTTFSAANVPVPAAAWLFGSALLGLGVVRRKK